MSEQSQASTIVFITWSGERSRIVAEALRHWLPSVLQEVEPWISTDDIRKGQVWIQKIRNAIEVSVAGIVVATRDNLTAPWLLYEAGALSRRAASEEAYVCVLGVGLDTADLGAPLSMHQFTKAEKDDIAKLLLTINSLLKRPLSEKTVRAQFDRWWGDLESAILQANAPMSSTASPKSVRSDRELLEEIVGILRETRQAASLELLSTIGKYAYDSGPISLASLVDNDLLMAKPLYIKSGPVTYKPILEGLAKGTLFKKTPQSAPPPPRETKADDEETEAEKNDDGDKK